MPTLKSLAFLILLPWAARVCASEVRAEPRPTIPLALLPSSLSSLAIEPAPSVLFDAPTVAPATEVPASAAIPSVPDGENARAERMTDLFDRAGEEGVRRIRLVRAEGDSAEDQASALAYLAALARAPRLSDPRESPAIERLKPLFRLRTRHRASLDPADPHALVLHAAGRLPKFGAYRYVDLTNGSRFSTTDAHGGVHHFVAVRALREGYSVRVDMRTGDVATDRYVSDQLLFEVKYDPRGDVVSRKFSGPMVLSTSDDILVKHGRFVFEDGRVFSPAPGKLAVGGTVVADFLNRPKTISFRNAFGELDVDPESGLPRVRIDPATGDPAWHYLSPAGSDVKNGMVLSTGRGQEVVALLRLYTPEPIGARIPAGYSLLRLSFPSYDAFLRYDSKHLLEDSSVLLASDDLRETYADDPRVTKSGFGPGSKPARVSMRRNGDVYLQESLGARAVKLGRVPAAERPGFPLRPGERKWLFLGHQLRRYRDGLSYRDYNAFAWLTDESMGRVERVRGALMSADGPLDSGESSLIVDLTRHNYPMGAEVMENGEYHISYGASDKHTGAAKLDVLALLHEMSDGSPETREGLAYRPRARP